MFTFYISKEIIETNHFINVAAIKTLGAATCKCLNFINKIVIRNMYMSKFATFYEISYSKELHV